MTIAGISRRQASAQIRENRGSRALVPVTPATATARPEPDHPRAARPASTAPFLAHLAARGEGAPQPRPGRRADRGEGVGIYQSKPRTAPANGQQMSRLV